MANESHENALSLQRGHQARDTGQNEPSRRAKGSAVPSPLSARSRQPGSLNPTGGSSKSLQKAIRILLHMGEHGPEMGVTQIATALSLNKATVHRLLNAMEKFGFIEKSGGDHYRLGLKLHELGAKAVESRTLQTEAHRFLLELSRASRETVSLAVPGAGGVLCLDRVNSQDSIITVQTAIGARFPAHCAAVAKAALAYLPEQEVDAILAIEELTRFTPFTMTSVAEVKKNLREVAERGYALDNEEFERGVSGVAAPVRSRDGQVIAAVGMAGPSSRFLGKELAQKVALTKEIASRISASLGEDSPRAGGS